MGCDSFPGSATINAVCDVAGGCCGEIGAGEAVYHDLVDGPGAPLVFGGCRCREDEQNETKEKNGRWHCWRLRRRSE